MWGKILSIFLVFIGLFSQQSIAFEEEDCMTDSAEVASIVALYKNETKIRPSLKKPVQIDFYVRPLTKQITLLSPVSIEEKVAINSDS